MRRRRRSKGSALKAGRRASLSGSLGSALGRHAIAVWSSTEPRGRLHQQTGGCLFLGPGGTGKSHLAQAIAQAVILQGCRLLYRETHVLLDELAEAVADGTRKEYMESVATVPLLIVDDFGMRKLPHTAAEDLLKSSCAATNASARCSHPIVP